MNYATHAWTTPGGRVELGESPLDALKREVLEESGLDVVVDELVGVYSKPYKDDIVLFFRARVVRKWPIGDHSNLATCVTLPLERYGTGQASRFAVEGSRRAASQLPTVSCNEAIRKTASAILPTKQRFFQCRLIFK
jgi:ADP-ribose pyrophosphatase YjhB (NUDIX family)